MPYRDFLRQRRGATFLGQLWSQTVVHLPPGDLGRLRPYSDRVGCRSAGSGAYLIRPARADEPKSSAHSHAELGSLSSSSLLSPCRTECRQGVELQAYGWRSISATAKNDFDVTRVEHRGFEPRTPCLPGKCSPAELMPREFKSVTARALGGQMRAGTMGGSGRLSMGR